MDRFLYRSLEILPALLAWGFLGLLIGLSFILPTWVAIFIIVFDFAFEICL